MLIDRASAIVVGGLVLATIALALCGPSSVSAAGLGNSPRAAEPLKVVKKVVIRTGPSQVAVNASGSRAYVTSVSAGNLFVVDATRGRIVQRPKVPKGSSAIAVGSDGKVYVGTPGTDQVTVLSGSGESIATLSVKTPVAIAANPKSSTVYVASENGGVIAVIDGSKGALVGSLPSAGQTIGPVHDVAVNPTGTRVYAVDGDSLHGFDLATGAPALEAAVPGNAVGVDLNGDGSIAYVLDNVGNRVLAINTSNGQLVATITSPSFGGPTFVAANGPTDRLYVSNNSYYALTVIDMSSNSVLGVVKYGGGGGVAVNASGSRVVDAGAALKTTVIYSPRK